ncbi:Putative pseudouridine synthase I, TruA, pseudouridine synthase TruA/RsuA/RluB/E/F [Septoria linicola]|uniref:Pseudouridine synthase I, TruA, pseudouridine synthase TruA/RsuA/RluB/E/F n=1 Tax=Septoria linicola TaxID=215465 RepID=A0A9Q9EKD7_9PEZI|nr:putative pseudouridine synthase I, TruA, pseudouridine synthase TruA/RsuA/RluB/E/F [Septoria linicola]USW53955.1 Putative pseudouridine synthase I, TruA, pseudouridine synthase TruA/RsuA/RluB/E/F [Septoria linicola]
MDTDYTSWSNTDLVKRVSELEAQLRRQNATHGSSRTSSTPPKRKPKKEPKKFDASRYHTRLIALKFAYLGGNYNGFEHHANNTTPLPTIEEELWRAMRKVKLIFPEHKPGQSEEDVCWDGIDYSKCGRTDRGVSAFGQVIGVRLRSARPRRKMKEEENKVPNEVSAGAESQGADSPMPDASEETTAEPEFDPIRDELPYIQLINRVLPSDIRILAWCPDPGEDFSARFNCKERRYRYFFTNPAYTPLPGSKPADESGRPGEGYLDIEAMNAAAKKYEGLHDFRNLCKVDPSKQITNWERRIFHAGIHEVDPHHFAVSHGVSPKLYYFEVRGSAFLWHQVRHLVAVLFLVGQGYEQPSVVDDLLDVQKTPGKPHYEMASDVPLVLWDCIFPKAEEIMNVDHASNGEATASGYHDAMNWIHIGDEVGGREQAKRSIAGVEDGKHGRNGIMDELWGLWRQHKMDEVLAWSLMGVVSAQGKQPLLNGNGSTSAERSARVFDGSAVPRAVGTYIPIAKREQMETPDVVNARYAARKGLVGRAARNGDVDE